jgi:transglutaminase-like putative cysteine protease
MDRRDFLMSAGATTLAATLPRSAHATASFTPKPAAWRAFDLTTRVAIDDPQGHMQAWIPLPSVNEAEWSRIGASTWSGNAVTVERVRDATYGAEMLHVVWADDEIDPTIEVISRVTTRDRAIDFNSPGHVAALGDAARKLYLQGTDLIPVDGIVKDTAERIIGAVHADSDLEKARAIYQWVVENTVRTAATRGCGIGDVAAMLKSGNLGGKCADLNALYVGLARASGLPARDVYGLRVAPSKFGYKSLGAGSGNVTRAQHCRAEVWLTGFGWVPVDPADVRKVMLEEPPTNLPLTDSKVAAARKTLFGAWEGNWIAYNTAHDLTLPGSDNAKVGFLMYPQAERARLQLDSLAPDRVRYSITVQEAV